MYGCPSARCPLLYLPGPVLARSSVGIRQPTEFQRTSENPIAALSKLCGLLPHFESVEKFTGNFQRLARLIGFHVVYHLARMYEIGYRSIMAAAKLGNSSPNLESKISSPLSHVRKISKPTFLAQTGTQ
jgi:hypothetical protein